mgnify:CR=1 FL=1
MVSRDMRQLIFILLETHSILVILYMVVDIFMELVVHRLVGLLVVDMMVVKVIIRKVILNIFPLLLVEKELILVT